MKLPRFLFATVVLALLLAGSLSIASNGWGRDPRDVVARGIVERLNAQTIDELFPRYYADDVTFADPTSTVHGAAALEAKFKAQYDQVDLFDVKVLDVIGNGASRVVTWEITSKLKIAGRDIGQAFVYKGNSVFYFNCENKVTYHRDYYDQFPLYEQIPGFDAAVGGMLGQYIAGQLGTPPATP